MSTATILVTCVGGELSPYLLGLLKTSRRHRLTLIGVDARPDAAGRAFVDHFETVPRGSDAGYVDRLLEIADRYGADMVYPTSDEEVLALSAQRERIEIGGRMLACNDRRVIEIVTNKAETYRYLDTIGVATPDSRQAESAQAVMAAVIALVDKRGAAVVKPASARGGRGIYVVSKDGVSTAGYQGSREIFTIRRLLRATISRSWRKACRRWSWNGWGAGLRRRYARLAGPAAAGRGAAPAEFRASQ